MVINISESINATIAKGGATGDEIEVGSYMEVDLIGSTFDITPIAAGRQFIASDAPTISKWNVNPRKIGDQTLDRSAYVIIKMPDGNEEKMALVKTKIIHVQVNPNEKQDKGNLIFTLFEGPWAKPIGALSGLAAFIVIFFKGDILAWIRSRRKLHKD